MSQRILSSLVVFAVFGAAISGEASSNAELTPGTYHLPLVRVWPRKQIPSCNWTYVKVPKAASSTMALVTERAATLSGFFYANELHATGSTCGIRGLVHTFAGSLHLWRLNRTPESNYLYSFVRDPVDRIASERRHFKALQNGMLPLSEVIRTYHTPNFQTCYLYVRCDLPRTDAAGHPQDLEDHCKGCRESHDRPEEVVAAILRDYDFIGVSERLDESLVVMSTLLNIPIEYFVPVSINTAGNLATDGSALLPKNNSLDRLDRHEQHDILDLKLNADLLLHKAANASLDATIAALGGHEALAPKLARFVDVRQKTETYCSRDKLLGPSAQLPNHTVFRFDKARLCADELMRRLETSNGTNGNTI